MDKNYGFPVYGTQGGGLVRRLSSRYEFVEAPDCPGLEVGDLMPEEWSIVPANELAHADYDEAQEDDRAFAEFYSALGGLVREGRLSPEDVRAFAPPTCG